MITLYLILFLMLALAVILLVIPILKNRRSSYYLVPIFLIIASVCLYYFFNNLRPLQQWTRSGQQHYQLLEKFNELGGVEGAIKQIKDKLAVNPNDAQGWYILGKLYLSKPDQPAATDAFAKAHQLQPNNPEITHYYQLTTHSQ